MRSDRSRYYLPTISNILALLIFILLCSSAIAAVPQIVIHWSSDKKLGSEVFLQDAGGTAVSAGKSYNGDGSLVVLGYFDDSDTANPFRGNWIPLTPGTRVGDSSTGYGFKDGHFFVTSVFTRDSDVVEIYPTEPAFYETTASHPIYNNLPKPNITPICIRFYDSHEITLNTKYNTVTGPDWIWPAFSSGIPENLYLKVSNNTPPFNSIWKYGYQFQYSASPKTTEPVDAELPHYSLTVNTQGAGTVSEHNSTYKAGTIVELTATPNDSQTEFAYWSGSGLLQTQFSTTYANMTDDLNITAHFQPKRYSVSIKVEGTGNVSISSAEDDFPFGDILELNATTSFGHEFSHWLGVGPDSNESFTTLTVNQDHELTAVFVTQDFDLNVSVADSSHGTATVTTEGPYTYASRYIIQAQPKTGFQFSHWSSPNGTTFMLDDANLSSTGMALLDHANLVANFNEIFYNLDVSMGNGGQSVSPSSGLYSAANPILVSAIAATGHDFHKWNDPSGVLTDPYSAQTDANLSLVSGDVMLIANFKKKNFQINLTENTGGNVILELPNGPWEYLGVYKLDAVAQPGYKFSHWSGGASSLSALRNDINDSNNSLNVSDNIDLTANFELIKYSVSVSTTNGGLVSGGGDFNVTSLPIISAYPGNGWKFSHWEGNETHLTQLSSTTSSTPIVNLGGGPVALSYEAHFIKDAFTLTAGSIGDGLVNGNSNVEINFEYDDEITLIAEAKQGWSFERWFDTEVTDPYSSNLVFKPNADTTINALFVPNNYNVAVNSSLGGAAEGGGTFEFGSRIILKAVASPGYQFSAWSGDIEFLEDNENAETFLTIPDKNISLSATFSPLLINVNLLTSGNGAVSGGGVFQFGDQASLQATPQTGNVFEEWVFSWSDGNETKSTENPITFTTNMDLAVTAKFAVTPEQVINYTLNSSPTDSGILYDDPEQRIWNPITEIFDRKLYATPKPGFTFTGWSTSPNLTISPSSVSHSIEISPTNNSTVTANFTPKVYKLVPFYDSDKGMVSGNSESLTYLASGTLTATPKEGYEFDHWKINRSISYDVQIGTSSVDSNINRLLIDNNESPHLTLIRGFTYVFQVDLDSDTDAFFISTTPFNENTFDDEWTSGVLNSRINEGIFVFQVPMDAPNILYYLSSENPYAGNTLQIINKSDSEILPVSKNPTINPIMDTDLSYEAVFTNTDYDLSVTTTTGGEVNLTSGSFPYGSTVSLSATPNNHYRFVRWEGDQQIDGQTNPTTSVELTSDSNVRAIFTPILYPLVVKTDPENAGIIETEGNLFDFPYGTEVEISVTPSDRYVFAHWFGNVSNPNNRNTTVVINSATEVTAHLSFAPLIITPIIKSVTPLNEDLPNQDSGGSITIPSISNIGKAFPVSATPSNGFSFKGWYDVDGKLLSSASSTYLTFYEDASVEARFQQKSYNVELSVKDPLTGMVKWGNETPVKTTTQSVAHGTVIQISGLPENGYEFSRWTIRSAGFKTSNESTLDWEVTENLEIEASFKQFIPELTIYAYPAGTGIIPTGNGPKSSNESHIIMAQALSGYEFAHWIGQGVADPTNPTTTVSFNEHQTIVARFKKTGEELPSMPVVDEDRTNSGELSDDWFGKVWSDDNSELEFHEKIGWIYIQEKTDDSLWFWIPSLSNWYWTDKDSFPTLYDDARFAWVELDLALSTPENVVIRLPQDQGTVENPLIPGAIKQSETSRWWISDWYDPYWHAEGSRWAYHRSLGWMYLHPSGLNSVWSWIEILNGWYWTSSECYPYIYEYSTDEWMWFDRINSSLNLRMFYRFGSPAKWVGIK